ncbi:MAG: YgiQ family radical SAM protein [Myxococcales bacterium]|nr:YgiQ family radical SAM protein [Myxococcales bacterium]
MLDPRSSIFAGAKVRSEQTPAPFLPSTRREMRELGWDECDVIIVTGDAYVDHPSFGMALIGRVLEAQGYRVGIIAQPAWDDSEAFKALGRPRLFFGVTGGNMDSMVNRYTSDHKVRNDDAYTPGGEGGSRPDRSVLIYSNRCRQGFKGVGIVIGGIEASLRRLAHFDYWSNKVRRSILFDAKADILLFGNAERAIVELTRRLDGGEPIREIRDIRGTAFAAKEIPDGYHSVDSKTINSPGIVGLRRKHENAIPCERQVIELPSFADVSSDKQLYAHASRIVHLEANPGNARAMVQEHDGRLLWINPPPIPLTSADMDGVYELPYARVPHPAYKADIPAYNMIKSSVTIMRGCFGGCTFCSISEHEGRIIQSRSQKSILREISEMSETIPGFTGVVSDIGGPTANMYRLGCKSREVEAACRRPSCVYPGICSNLKTDHSSLVDLYRKARSSRGIKRVFIASGVRYDLAVESPEYVKELVQHHVGGYLKIAPEHTREGPLTKMMKPGIDTYDRFERLFEKFSKQAGKDQYLIPYFIAAHPGTTDEDMLELSLWLKRHGFKADQVQTYLPAPMATATTMYHTEKNPLKSLKANEAIVVPKGQNKRTLHKAFLRYHDPNNWPLLRDALRDMGREDLIGGGSEQLIPLHQPRVRQEGARGKRSPAPGRPGPKRGGARTQHTGLPPKHGRPAAGKRRSKKRK